MYNLATTHPKSFKKLAGWTLRSHSGYDKTPVSDLSYHFSPYTPDWSFFWKNGNGRTMDILKLFDFFEQQGLQITIKEYRNRDFETLFSKLESLLPVEDTSAFDAAYQRLMLHKGCVYTDGSYKYCIKSLEDVNKYVGHDGYVKVADRPHGDGDYSYTCGLDYCRCMQ